MSSVEQSRMSFRFATFITIALVQRSLVGSQVVYPSCRYDSDTWERYSVWSPHEGRQILRVRGVGSVELHNVTCTCHVGTASISITYLSDEENVPSVTVSPPTCVGAPSCNDFRSCQDLNENVFTKVELSGSFNYSAVIECGNTADPNKAQPIVVWVEPSPEPITPLPSPTTTTSTQTSSTSIQGLQSSSSFVSGRQSSRPAPISSSLPHLISTQTSPPSTMSTQPDPSTTVIASANRIAVTAVISTMVPVVIIAVVLAVCLLVIILLWWMKTRQRDPVASEA